MDILPTRIKTDSSDYQDNQTHHSALNETLKTHLEKVRQGGGAEAVKRHRARGKFLARERIEKILDPGAPFFGVFSVGGQWLVRR
jgi:3-methylcrotonyl-CoA carboxylase beta subunit